MAGMKYRITVDLVAHGETMEQAVYALFQQAMEQARKATTGDSASACLMCVEGGNPPELVGRIDIEPIKNPIFEQISPPSLITIESTRH